MTTIEDVINNMDKKETETFEKRLLGYIRQDLARVGFYETYVQPYGISNEEGREKLKEMAESVLSQFKSQVYERIKDQTKEEVKYLRFPKIKKEYKTIRNATTKAFKRFKPKHITDTFMIYHFYRKFLEHSY